MKLPDFTALLILLGCYVLGKRSDDKMNKSGNTMPVKEWLEYRINELKKTIYMKTKHNILSICLAFLSGFWFYAVSQIVIKAPFSPLLSGAIFIGLIVYLVIADRSLNRKYKNA
jgi:uncharacterized membrane protein SirB2